MTIHRCIGWALAGAVLGVAVVAWGQEAGMAPAPVQAADPTTALLSQLLAGGGLPAVLAALGWWVGRGGLVLTVRLHDDDRKLVERATRRLARAVEDPPTDPRRRDDDSDGSLTQ